MMPSPTFNASQQVLNLYNTSTYNTGCIDDINKATAGCSQFKANVVTNLGLRFEIGLIALSLLILFSIYTRYMKPKFSQTEEYQRLIADNVDLAMLVLSICLVGYIFL